MNRDSDGKSGNIPGRQKCHPTSPADEQNTPQHIAKHRRIFDHLLANIQSGVLKSGDRLPSEAELGALFEASRITVAKAVLDLQRMGLVRADRAQVRMCWGSTWAPGAPLDCSSPSSDLPRFLSPSATA